MAFSKTYICNRASSKLGSSRVSNIDTDDTKEAKTLRYMYDMVRDALLQAYPWNFAIKRAQLAVDANAPIFGYSNKYQLPTDFLALIEVQGNPEYKIEGGYILTDEGAPLYIKYIARITDTATYDALFADAFATKLALEACEEITQSNTKKQILYEEFRNNISNAYANDAIQDQPVKLTDDAWILSREGTTYNINYYNWSE